MDIRIGDLLVMKKNHPCGGNQFLVLRSGADLKLRCTTCGREMISARVKAEKHIKSILSKESGREKPDSDARNPLK